MTQAKNNIIDKEFLRRLERLAIVNKRMKNGIYSGKRRSKNQGSSIDFADYRSYTPGDDFRQLDWNAYARQEKLFLKTYYDEQELHISLYIDCSKSMSFGQPNKFQTGLKLAAALGYISLNHFDRLSVYGFANSINSILPSLFGKGKVHQLFNFLQTLDIKDEGDINKALATGKATSRKPGISIIISDFLFANGYEAGINFIQAANQEVILVQILAEEEIKPNYTGDLKLLDSETSFNKEVAISPYVLSEYRKTFNDFQHTLTQYAYKRGIAFVTISSQMSLEQIVFTIFKRSGLIR